MILSRTITLGAIALGASACAALPSDPMAAIPLADRVLMLEAARTAQRPTEDQRPGRSEPTRQAGADTAPQYAGRTLWLAALDPARDGDALPALTADLAALDPDGLDIVIAGSPGLDATTANSLAQSMAQARALAAALSLPGEAVQIRISQDAVPGTVTVRALADR